MSDEKNILRAFARVYVDDPDAVLPLYEHITGRTDINRFGSGEMQLTNVGDFLLIQEGEFRYTSA
ncbi:hypothetical protein [Bifidobacterium sp.]|uniref:hypothetical protein n=1 Tax=Bifidobacterium sp. TaxID=41200 RepID=UPI0025BFE040|nr:hypothetical protein [Bifidobacterium sp.]MCH4209940.1 hypothetical protein [Bifidobacterium sp.]MCI1225321.1 hypothetical protein [Bifidobacterium sp.]